MDFALPTHVTETLKRRDLDAGTLSHLANHTSLSALSATIEAARAGAAGRGFLEAAAKVQALIAGTAATADEIACRIEGVREADGPWAAEVGTDGAAAPHVALPHDSVPANDRAASEIADLDDWIDIFFTQARHA